MARTFQESPLCTNTCWWSMEPAVPRKYCYITFQTRISFKEHMKKVAHLLPPGPASVKGGFVREFMLLLDRISLGEQSARERGGSPRIFCDKAFKSLPTPNQHKLWQHSGNVFVCKGCGKKFKANIITNRHKKLVCGKPHQRNKFCNFSINYGSTDCPCFCGRVASFTNSL